jgi:hypothetical protein
MPEVPDIGVRDINIREIKPNPIFNLDTPRVLVPTPPITTYLQKPIVSYPGCVENVDAVEDDQKIIQCDGRIPSYEPLNFEPQQFTPTRPAGLPKNKEEKQKEVIQQLPQALPPSTASVTKEEAPPTVEPEIPWTQKYLPEPAAVTTTASIALIATTSALLAKPLADLLLKLVKPTVKKVVKKVSKMRGKPEVVLSLQERRREQSETNHAKAMMRKLLKGK